MYSAGAALLSRSGLPKPQLARAWALADVDGDGRLSRGEFVVAFHLVKLAAKHATTTILVDEARALLLHSKLPGFRFII